MRFRNHPVAHTPVEPTNIGSSSLLADLPTTYASRHFAFARNDYAPTASSGHPLTGPRNPRGFWFALVLQIGALATSVSGSLRQGPGIGLAPTDAHLQSPGHCQSREPLAWLRHVRGTDLHKHVGRRVTTIGWWVTGKVVTTKEDEPMEFISFEDTSALYETTFFPQTYARFCHMLNRSRPYVLTGLVEEDFDAVTLTVDSVRFL